MWLSFSIIISNKPILWLMPPPIRTAHFSGYLKLGVVFRVSNKRQLVWFIFFDKRWVRLAIPLMRCMQFNTKRSVANKSNWGPSIVKTMSPGCTSAPSLMAKSIVNSGFCLLKMISANSTPAIIPGSFTRREAVLFLSLSKQAKLLWSPS